jgi:hypothetical protein
MPDDVFISHSVKDQKISESIYAYLESNEIKCFMDARDLLPGKPYTVQLADAIKGSRAVVLVFSSSSDVSEAVQNEVGLARNNKIPIIPFRTENIFPHGLALFITTSQWLDAFPLPIDKYLPDLVKAIKAIIGIEEEYGTDKSEPSTLINDQDWHDIDYGEMNSWLRNRIKLLDAGKTIRGRTFVYRRNRYTSKYQRKLRDDR